MPIPRDAVVILQGLPKQLNVSFGKVQRLPCLEILNITWSSYGSTD
ncbi:hypothetical protein [Chroococcidiopsis sp. TS-821]|nr:hypothetical protein [Chroococcidiopsis sp. TS-821]